MTVDLEIFTIRNYSSQEEYDIAKFLDFKGDTYDVINSPFLKGVSELNTVSYYSVDEGSKQVDQISQEVYGSPYFVFLIQYYNGIFLETFPEGTILNMFSITDLNNLYSNLANGILP